MNLSSAELAKWASETEGRIGGALEIDGLLAKAESIKANGNEAFKAGETHRACTLYNEAVEVLTSENGKATLQKWWAAHKDSGAIDAASPLLASLHTNLAACHNKLGQWEAGTREATAALTVDANNVKARFRRGVANSNLGNFDDARTDLT
eukprot:6581536-Prymnesium_polylepis.1